MRRGSGSVSLGLPLGEGPRLVGRMTLAPRPKGGRGKLTHYLTRGRGEGRRQGLRHQARQRFSGAIGAPALHWKACWNSGMLTTVPSTR